MGGVPDPFSRPNIKEKKWSGYVVSLATPDTSWAGAGRLS